jgi:hypothetical protein
VLLLAKIALLSLCPETPALPHSPNSLISLTRPRLKPFLLHPTALIN